MIVPCGALIADPPWPTPTRGDKWGAASNQYGLMSMEDLYRFPLPPLEKDCYLFLWRVTMMSEEAFALMKAWGFTFKTEFVWCKKTVKGKRWFGMGTHNRGEHETCLLGVRGSPKPQARNIRSTFDGPVLGHSRKPDSFYELVEKLARGPYTELFARRTWPGWQCFGNQLDQGAANE